MWEPTLTAWTFLRRLPRDTVLAACLLITAQLELLLAGPFPERWIAVIAAFGLTVPFVWWHRRPLVVLGVVMASFLTQTALGVADNTQVVVPLVWSLASFGVGAYSTSRVALAGLLLVALPIGGLVAIGGIIPTMSDLLYAATIFTTVPWVTGRVYRARRAEAVEYARRAALAEAEAEARAREVLETERRRIARELHDIIAHSISLMVLQAGAAGEVLERSPGRAREALNTV